MGIARTHEAALIFHHGTRTPSRKDTLAADIQSPPLAYAGYESYREKKVAMALPESSRFPAIAAGLDNLVNFWLFHQRYWNWYGLWDYGDIQHRFRSGTYGNMLDAERLIEMLQIPREERTRQMMAGHTRGDFIAQQDWLFDNGRWGWTNTEGLPGLFLQNEYLRTGRRDVYFAAEAIARHSRDVVTRHSGRYFGTGTRFT